jgi:uncharacterized membrane protein
MVDYALIKALHVTGAVLLVGNVTVTGVWAYYLYRWWREGTVPFRPIARAILWTDLIFTLGGGAMLSVSGIVMLIQSGLPWRELSWIREGIGALVLSTLLWLVLLLPAQWQMERVTDAAVIRRLFLRWSVIGWAATILLFYGLYVMVTKR